MGRHGQPPQPDLGRSNSAWSRRCCRTGRNVDRPSRVVSRADADRVVRSYYRGAEYRVVAVQFASVRFHARVALCVRSGCLRRHGAAALARKAREFGRGHAVTPLDLPARPRILVITMRRLGDVLLTTPLIRSIRRGFPGAELDVLVFRGSEGILEGNPDIDGVTTVDERPLIGEGLGLIGRMWRRY